MTALERNPLLLQQLLDSTDDLIVAIEFDSSEIYANLAARDFWGQDYPALARAVLAGKEKNPGSTVSNQQSTILTVSNKDGKEVTCRCTFSSVTTTNNRLYQLASLRDITSLKKSGRSLRKLQRNLNESTRIMDTLSTLTVEIMKRNDLPSLLQHVADNLDEITGADYAYVAMVHESGAYLETLASSHNSGSLKTIKHKPGEGIGGKVWITGKTILTNDYQNAPWKLPGLTDARQACSVPIIVKEKVVGVLGVMHKNDDIEIELQRELLEKFSMLLTVGIVNTELHENMAAELSRTEAISELSHLIYASADFKTLLDRVCITLVSAFDASKAHIYRYHESGPDSLEPVVAWEERDGVISPALQASGTRAAQSIATWCINNQKTASIPRGVDDPRESAEVHQARRDMNLGSTVCVPLIHGKTTWGILYAHRHLQQSDFTDSDINLFKVIGSQASVALHRHDLIEKIQYQAYHDQLTGLPNRLRFESLLEELINGSESKAAVLFIDLDGFKSINDTLSHHTGDQLLQQVANRFSTTLGETGLLARLGGDEFAAILPQCGADADANTKAQQLLDSLDETFVINNAQVSVGASIGVSFYPDDASTATDLLKNADIAMYHAKSGEKGTVSVFDQSHAERYEQHLAMELDLKQALAGNQFELYYQPKVSCESGLSSSVEALIRWNHPTRGMVSPFEFITVAEKSGLIQEIGTWVINEACRFCKSFSKQGLALGVAVNISAIQFAREDFTETVQSILEQHDFPAEKLELEVTESVVMKDVARVVERLSELRALGITVAIDDFGTGYSSLKYLDDLPLDTLKIDKAFVDKLNTPINKRSLVKTIVVMANSFDLKTVAEGVETAEQFKQISELGCDFAQGYYFSKPVPGEDLWETLAKINDANSLKKAS